MLFSDFCRGIGDWESSTEGMGPESNAMCSTPSTILNSFIM